MKMLTKIVEITFHNTINRIIRSESFYVNSDLSLRTDICGFTVIRK